MIKQYYMINDEWYERIPHEVCPRCKGNIAICDCNKQYQIDVIVETKEILAFHNVYDYEKRFKEKRSSAYGVKKEV